MTPLRDGRWELGGAEAGAQWKQLNPDSEMYNVSDAMQVLFKASAAHWTWLEACNTRAPQLAGGPCRFRRTIPISLGTPDLSVVGGRALQLLTVGLSQNLSCHHLNYACDSSSASDGVGYRLSYPSQPLLITCPFVLLGVGGSFGGIPPFQSSTVTSFSATQKCDRPATTDALY